MPSNSRRQRRISILRTATDMSSPAAASSTDLAISSSRRSSGISKTARRWVDEEQFAPILPVIRYDDLDEVIDRANAGPHGARRIDLVVGTIGPGPMLMPGASTAARCGSTTMSTSRPMYRSAAQRSRVLASSSRPMASPNMRRRRLSASTSADEQRRRLVTPSSPFLRRECSIRSSRATSRDAGRMQHVPTSLDSKNWGYCVSP